MDFFRYLFLILILSGSTSIGFLISKRYKERVKELNAISRLINILQNKIKFTHMPLGEILEEISDIKTNPRISDLFYKVSQKLKTKSTQDSWDESIEEEKFYLNLKNEDINLIKSLGNTLGKTDTEGQMSGIHQFNTLLQIQIKEAEQERLKNEKMYKSLGTIVGLAIVILLF